MARITFRARQRSRGRATRTANVRAAMTKRSGIQPGSGINGSTHGTSAAPRSPSAATRSASGDPKVKTTLGNRRSARGF